MQGLMAFHLYNIVWQTEYIHTYTLFNLEFKVAKDKLVSSSYKYDFQTTKTKKL